MKYIKKKSTVPLPPDITGNISDTLNVTDKVTNAPSIRLLEELIENVSESSLYDNTTSGLEATTIQGAIDEIVKNNGKIEKISNENGIAIKYPDGRMECRHFIMPTVNGNFTKAYGGVFLNTAGTLTWTYPVEFKEAPDVGITAYFQGGIGGANLSAKPTTTQATFYPWYAQSYTWTAGNYGYEVVATGYWK